MLLRYKASSAIKQEQHTFALNSFDKVLSSLLEQLALKVPDALSGNLRLTSSAEAGKCYSQLSSRTSIDALLQISLAILFPMPNIYVNAIFTFLLVGMLIPEILAIMRSKKNE